MRLDNLHTVNIQFAAQILIHFFIIKSSDYRAAGTGKFGRRTNRAGDLYHSEIFLTDTPTTDLTAQIKVAIH